MATIPDIRVAFVRLDKQTMQTKDLMIALDTVRRSNKLFPKELTIDELYDVACKLGWVKSVGLNRVQIYLNS